MIEAIFLLVLGLIWLVFASVQDLKHKEVANWLSFSLIIFSLGFRFFWSLFNGGFAFFYQGLIGLAIFLVIGNLFYYSRLFAGGDAKLMIALGAVLGFSEDFFINLKIYFLFLIIFLFAGAFYGLAWSFFLAFKNYKNFKKEFSRQLTKNKKMVFGVMILSLIVIASGFFHELLFYFGVLVFITPYLYIYAKAVDEACMIKKVKTKELVEGDWLYKDVKIGRKLIKTKWEGLSKEEIKILRKSKKDILIRHGIAFVPVFLIAFIVLILVWFLG